MSSKASVLIRGIPHHVRDGFKAHCAMRGKSMNKVIIDFMRSLAGKQDIRQKEDEWLRKGGNQ
jgi:hypothetical protein